MQEQTYHQKSRFTFENHGGGHKSRLIIITTKDQVIIGIDITCIRTTEELLI